MLLDLWPDMSGIQKRTGVPYTTLRDWANPKSRRHRLFSFLSDMESLLASAEKNIRIIFRGEELAALRASMVGTAPTSDFLESGAWELYWEDACVYKRNMISGYCPEDVTFEDFRGAVKKKLSLLDRLERYVLLEIAHQGEPERGS